MEFASYITGFTDGEGTFCVSFSRRTKLNTGIEVRPSFSISQHQRSVRILERIQQYFGCGGIRYSKRDKCYKYEVRAIDDLVRHIIPHFKKYPLQTSKQADFEHFASICELVASNTHLNRNTLGSLIERAFQMNQSGIRRYQKDELLQLLER
jgi:hypothetical protein